MFEMTFLPLYGCPFGKVGGVEGRGGVVLGFHFLEKNLGGKKKDEMNGGVLSKN